MFQHAASVPIRHSANYIRQTSPIKSYITLDCHQPPQLHFEFELPTPLYLPPSILPTNTPLYSTPNQKKMPTPTLYFLLLGIVASPLLAEFLYDLINILATSSSNWLSFPNVLRMYLILSVVALATILILTLISELCLMIYDLLGHGTGDQSVQSVEEPGAHPTTDSEAPWTGYQSTKKDTTEDEASR